MDEKISWNFDKRADRYDDDANNYRIPEEIMVTITLNEYRGLIQAEANARAEKAEAKKHERGARIRELEEKLKVAEEKIDMLLCDKCGKKGETEEC